jgi:glycerol-3-phosphate acyltransferase PlsY
MILAATLALAYLLGSIPFSFVVARAFGVRDVREVGSGNVGATNVMRAAGSTAGILAFLLDAAKGAAAALLTRQLVADPALPSVAAAAAVIGHMYPVWLGFRGGKGVATGAGAFLPLAPLPTLLALLAFVATAAASRYVSLGSVVGTAVLAGAAFLLGAHPAVCWSVALIGALVVWKHRSNLRRIFRGEENALGARRA